VHRKNGLLLCLIFWHNQGEQILISLELCMADTSIFDVLLLLGRPAAGKSEILDFFRNTDRDTRAGRYHIGNLEVIDDFPMLWAWFEEDTILSEKFGKPRLHSDEKQYFIYRYLWNLLIERISLEYQKKIRDDNEFHRHSTAVVEFARGSEHGGYSQAFEHLSDQILSRASILYIQVSYEESLRKNRKRFNPQRPDSILEHAIDDEKLETLYRYDDWQDILARNNANQHISIRGHEVPFVVFENEDDVTTEGGPALGNRLEETLGRLWELENHAQRWEV
jgi:hypothetical protein